jgi:transcriptional regulator with XRE-family HTH domain
VTEAARLLRYARKRAGLSQRALAAKAGVPQPYIARIESSAADPTVTSLSRLLRACETTLEAMPGSGAGVDRTLLRAMLDRHPAERLADASADPLRVLHALGRHEVRYVLIGGHAARCHGAATPVEADVDVCADWSPDNLDRLATALTDLNARRRDGDGPLDAATLRDGVTFLLATDLGWLDVYAAPAGTTGYRDLAAAARPVPFDGLGVPVAALDDLIRMKRAAGRPKDRIAVDVLLALRDEVTA